MPRPAPTAVVGPASAPRTVTIDLAALIRLEQDLDLSIVEIAEIFRAAAPSNDSGRPKPLKLAFMLAFVASLLAVPEATVREEFGTEGILPAFSAMSGLFVEAVQQLHAEGGAEGNAGGAEGSPDVTARGRGLSLASAPTSSGDWDPPTSAN